MAPRKKKTIIAADRYATYEFAQKTADFLGKNTTHRPKVGIVCGSGLGGLGELLTDKVAFNYKDIPGFPVSTVVGHSGKLIFGNLNGVATVCMQGRFHYYEGHPLSRCVFPVRVMKLLGVENLIVTNAAGGVNPDFKIGDIMLIKDHISFLGLSGLSPLRGPNDERWGLRFPAMSNAYNAELRCKAKRIAKDLRIESFFREGVYVAVGGPSYESIAEIKLIRVVGGDAVGMSTVPEVVVAHHCGMRVLGISLITNECIADYETKAISNHEEVLQTAEMRKKDLEQFVSKIVAEMV